jgi:hypothetical protein
MYELFLAALLISGVNVGIAYGAIEIWKLDYASYIAAKVAIGFVLAMILKVFLFTWKDRLMEGIKQEYEDKELFLDVILFLIVLIAGGLTTLYLVYRRYGVVGWLGSLAANYAVNVVV